MRTDYYEMYSLKIITDAIHNDETKINPIDKENNIDKDEYIN